MLHASGPQAGQHGDGRAVVWASRGGLSPSRGPAGAPGAHGSVTGPWPGSQATALSQTAFVPLVADRLGADVATFGHARSSSRSSSLARFALVYRRAPDRPS